ncbi:MAG: dihydroorotase [Firmicutes bacterium HGW-Firmicutes-9]|jgi:dihydroorotase|nr:MAG: dihydroorotase [Firmicutes bacterium HGW-Firmicutes-9]
MITLYRNARLIDAQGERYGDLCIEDGVITACAALCWQKADRVIDMRRNALMPAFIDLHCHLRDPGYPEKETMETGMRAALKGGYAHLIAMANTSPVMATPAMVQENHEKANHLRLCKLTQAAAAGESLGDDQPTDRAELSKVTKVLSNDGKTIFSDEFMRQLLLDSTKYGFLISTHCQPERKIVERDINLLREVGGNLHIGHISRAETVEMVRRAKAEGLQLTCEVTPHHLFGWDSDYKVNPPLRTRADVDALIEGIKDGTIDCLATDHAPHTPADKANGMAGISNIEHAFQIYLKVFQENNIPLTRLSEMLSLAPAKRLGIKAGLFLPGYAANVTALSVEEESEIDTMQMISRSHNTPFHGRKVMGRVLRTVIDGETRYEYNTAI